MFVAWANQWIICMRNSVMNKFAALLAVLLSAGCSGTVDKNDDQGTLKELVLQADVAEIMADGESAVSFTVLYGDEDVTSEATIKCITDNKEVSGGSFSSESVGTFVFKAFYEKAVSGELEVKVGTKFSRRVCVMEFTGAWCAQCPAGATTLDFLVSRTYKGQAFAMAFHNGDDFELPVEKELAKLFKVDAYPSFVTDMRDAGQLNGGGCSDSIEYSLYESETHCSVSVSCSYSETAGCIVDAMVFSEKEMAYRLAAYVVEDKIKGEQTQADGTKDRDYMHRHVVRSMLSSSVKGDALENLPAGAQGGKKFAFAPDKTWNIDNLSVVVLALDDKGNVNNMATCPVDGGTMGYGYVN